MVKTATVRARVAPDLKNEVEEILERLGLTASETIHLLYSQIKLQRGIPFEIRIPNEVTGRTLRASRKEKQVKHFKTKKQFYADLGL